MLHLCYKYLWNLRAFAASSFPDDDNSLVSLHKVQNVGPILWVNRMSSR